MIDRDTLFIIGVVVLTFIWLLLPPDDGVEA